MKWSTQQEAIFTSILSAPPGEHRVVVARAGTGKSSSALEAIRRLHEKNGKSKILYLAFNKVIAEEFAPRIEGMGECCTSHAWGYRQVLSAFPGLRVGRRAFGISRRLIGYWDRTQRGWVAGTLGGLAYKANGGTVSAIASLVDHAKDDLAETESAIEELVWRFHLATEPYTPAEAAQIALKILDETSRPEGEIDFADMLWLPWKCRLHTTHYDYVFVDEAQDFCPAQLALAQRAARKDTGHIIIIGDDRQAIYAWRGADPEAIPRMTRELRAPVLPLTITYRCPRQVVALAQRYVPDYSAAEWAPEGEVLSATRTQMLSDVQPGTDAIISRTNAPLIIACLALLRRGRRAYIRGRDVGQELKSLIQRSRKRTISDLLVWLGRWREREVERLEDAGKNGNMVDRVNDTHDTVRALTDDLETVEELIERIDALFEEGDAGEDDDRILLTSTHRGKGLEWDRVWMLRDTYLRSWIDRITGEQTEPGREEENLYYVAVTRAKRTLMLVDRNG